MKDKWFLLAVACAIVSAWMLRWDFQLQHGTDGTPAVYSINRFTGEIVLIVGIEKHEVKEEEQE